MYRPTGLPWLEPMEKTIVRSIGARVSIKRLKKVIGVLVANLEMTPPRSQKDFGGRCSLVARPKMPS